MTKQLKEELIIKRYSCRSYIDSALSETDINGIKKIISLNQTGPFESEIRFVLTAAVAGDSSALKDLGTYGFIKNPAAFIIGAAKNSGMYLEDYGYIMEKILLDATAMNLGTCWLGGSFKKSSFAARIGLGEDESVPAVAALGYIAEKKSVMGSLLKRDAGSKKRMPGSGLFFDENIKPLVLKPDNGYGKALEMVRLAPSANNKQPWRIIKDTNRNIFRFYLERSPLYLVTSRIFNLADMQRIDMGIAMCHFELTAIENNVAGSWRVESDPAIQMPKKWQYTATWFGE